MQPPRSTYSIDFPLTQLARIKSELSKNQSEYLIDDKLSTQ